MRTVFVHYEVDPKALQAIVPFPLHLYNGRAYVSLVGFTLERMRPHFGERILEWLFRPISNHQFLNVRTYLNQGGEPGIYFLAEWLNNRCSIPFGPPLFGLPYRYGKLSYQHDHPGADSAPIHGKVIGGHAWQISLVGRVSRRRQVRALNYSCRPRLEYHGAPCGNLVPAPCTAGSLDEFLLERYVASTRWMGINRYFRIWHPPWPQIPIDVNVVENKLLTANWPLFRDARLIGGHYSPGIPDVWMGQPHVVKSQNDSARDYDYDYE